MSTFISPLPSLPFPVAVPVSFSGAPLLDHFNACVILADGGLFTIGSFARYEFALQIAQEYALDLLRIPHVRADRALTTSELRAFTDDQLLARAKYLRSGWAHKITRAKLYNEQARIVQVQRARIDGRAGVLRQ